MDDSVDSQPWENGLSMDRQKEIAWDYGQAEGNNLGLQIGGRKYWTPSPPIQVPRRPDSRHSPRTLSKSENTSCILQSGVHATASDLHSPLRCPDKAKCQSLADSEHREPEYCPP